MPALDRAEARLENLEAIEPLLGSLRVLSLSTMQMALNRQQSLRQYNDRFLKIAAFLRSKPEVRKKKAHMSKAEQPLALMSDAKKRHTKRVVAVIGSSRGICGQYNKQLADQASKWIARDTEAKTEVLVFGPRLHNAMRAEGIAFTSGAALFTGSLPDYALVSQLMREWEEQLRTGEVESVSLYSFRRLGTRNVYKPKLTKLLPDSAQLSSLEALDPGFGFAPVIEGDPLEILARIEKHLNAIQLYDLILDAITAENLYRYRLLEEAKENTEVLLEELSITLQMERRKAITQQMQQLGVASGMLAER